MSKARSKKRYFEVNDLQEESKTEEKANNPSEKHVKTKRKQEVQHSDSDISNDDTNPKPKKFQRKQTQESRDSVKNDIPARVHDLSRFNPEKFRPSQHRQKKSLQSVQRGGRHVKNIREHDPFPGDAPIAEDKIQKYSRGQKNETPDFRTKFHTNKNKKFEKKIEKATEQAARTELLLTEQQGYVEADEGEWTWDITQKQITDCVDIASADKHFELKLDKFGPYRMNYTRNGRFLLLGGRKGHVAAIDWQTKKLLCEVNVMETCSDVKWLHIETMFAVAQRQWTYIYDNQGIELHCLKGMDTVLSMEFLPYHFLLASGNSKGYLQWLDVSVGQKVAGYMTKHGRLDVMCQNPHNAILHLGHSGGTVTLWSPNVKEPLVKMLCHGSGTRSLAVTTDGMYMATSGIDRTLKIWDLRTYKQLHGYRVGMGAGQLSFSQTGILAAGMGNIVQMYQDPSRQPETRPYLSHRLPGSIAGLQFCPYEDVLGVGHAGGFSSLLVPGAGEPNFDALEANPFQTKKQRQHAEVKMLLEKVQPDMISVDTSVLGKVDRKTLADKVEEKRKLLYVRPEKVDFEPKYKKKGRSKAGKVERRKQIVQEEHKREHIKQVKAEQKLMEKAQVEKPKPYNALDRFTSKKS